MASGDTQIETTRRRRPWPLDLYGSAVGKKYVMAVTGMVWMGYVLAHMVGNLSMYLGETELNHYAEWFRTLATPALPRTVLLWLLRFVLIVAIVLHVHPGAFAAVDTIGNVSFPIAVLAGVIG